MRRHPLRTAALVVTGALVLVVLAAVGVFFYLRSYTPLDASAHGYAPGPGLGADVEPTFGSGGKPVFIPGYKKGRPFDTAFTLENTGRFSARPDPGVSATGVNESFVSRHRPAREPSCGGARVAGWTSGRSSTG